MLTISKLCAVEIDEAVPVPSGINARDNFIDDYAAKLVDTPISIHPNRLIDNNIPVPDISPSLTPTGWRKTSCSSNNSSKYPFADMKVGDSFIVLNGKAYVKVVEFIRDPEIPDYLTRTVVGQLQTLKNAAFSSARFWAERHDLNRKFTVQLDEGHNLRCWRVA